MQDDSLTIVTVAKEPLKVMLRFVAWHRERGADHIRIYLDDPDDPVIPALEGVDYLTLIRCTPEFWGSVGVDPQDRFTKRQNAALTHGYRATPAGWVGVIDADELFYSQSRPLKTFLAKLPRKTRAVRFATAEIVHSDAPGQHFRTMMDKKQAHTLYGHAAGLIKRNGGLVGHTEGKSIIRAGLNVSQIRQHFPEDQDGVQITDLMVGHDAGCFLLHLIDEGYDSWRGKLDWRMNSWGFSGRMLAGLQELQDNEADTEDEFRKLYMNLHHFSAEQIAQLQGYRTYLTVPEDLMAPARRLFPETFVDGA
jgi:Glycosyl transferase family 2